MPFFERNSEGSSRPVHLRAASIRRIASGAACEVHDLAHRCATVVAPTIPAAVVLQA